MVSPVTLSMVSPLILNVRVPAVWSGSMVPEVESYRQPWVFAPAGAPSMRTVGSPLWRFVGMVLMYGP